MDVSLGSLITAVATPFEEDGRVDYGTFERLVAWLTDHGSDGVVVSGSTGESATLSDKEKIELFQVAKGVMPNGYVIAGATTNATQHSLELVKGAEDVGVDGILAVTPYYNRPSQRGLITHFSAILASTKLPVILYDIPIRTGRKIEHAAVIELKDRFSNLYGLKDASQTPGQAAALMKECGEDFSVFSGDDALTLPLMAVGAVGVISVASHWASPVFRAMIDSFNTGDVKRAAQLNQALVPSYSFQSQENAPNPTPLKAMLEVMGLCKGICRSPMLDPSDDLKKEAGSVLEALVKETQSLGVMLDESWDL